MSVLRRAASVSALNSCFVATCTVPHFLFCVFHFSIFIGQASSSSSPFRLGAGAPPPVSGRRFSCGRWSSSSQSQGWLRNMAHQGSWYRLQGGSCLRRLISFLLGMQKMQEMQKFSARLKETNFCISCIFCMLTKDRIYQPAVKRTTRAGYRFERLALQPSRLG